MILNSILSLLRVCIVCVVKQSVRIHDNGYFDCLSAERKILAADNTLSPQAGIFNTNSVNENLLTQSTHSHYYLHI